jgi:hypothetical protein
MRHMDTKSLIFIYAQASYLARTRQLYSSANRAKAPSSHYCKVEGFQILNSVAFVFWQLRVRASE